MTRLLNKCERECTIGIPLVGHRAIWLSALLLVVSSFSVIILTKQWIIGIGIFAVLLALIGPVEVALGMYAISIPFDNVFAPGTSTTLSWAAGAFAGGVLLILAITGRRLLRPLRPTLWWTLFTAWAIASVLWAIDSNTSAKWMTTAASLFALYIMAVNVQITERELWRLLHIMVAGGVFAAAILIAENQTAAVQTRASIVIADQASNPNQVGISLLLPFSVAMGLFMSSQTHLRRAVTLVAIMTIGFGIFLTMSRGALAALIATVIAFLLRIRIQKRLFAVVVILLISSAFLPDLFFQRLSELPGGRGTGRLDIFAVGIQIVKRDPVLGVGLANFNLAYDQYAGYAPVFHGYRRSPHNAFLQVCAETGVIGLMFFLIAIYSQMKLIRRAASNRDARDFTIVSAEAVGWGFIVAGLSGHITWDKSFWLGVILMGIIARRAQPQSRVVHAASL